MDFRILGPLEIHLAGRRVDIVRRRERALLGLLLLAPDTTVHADRLIAMLWEGEPPTGARRQLSVNVSRLRARLPAGGDLLVGGGYGYRLRIDPCVVDAHRFRLSVERAATLADPAAQAPVLEEAIALWRGPLLADALSDSLRQRLARGLIDLHTSALEMLCRAWVELGVNDRVIPRLYDLVEQHPTREGLHVLLMRALDADGRTTEALQYYLELRERWVSEFGLEPGTAVQDLHQRLIRGYGDALIDRPTQPDPVPVDASPTPPVAPAWPVPWQLPADVQTFTGRGAELDSLDGLLSSTGVRPAAAVVAAITGTAGVGKTALAVHWAHRAATWYPDGVLYVNLRGFDATESPADPGEALHSWLDALGVAPRRIPAELAARSALFRSRLAGKRVLLVLDNARDADQIRPLLPGTPGCLVLATSRNRLVSLVANEGAQPVLLRPLTAAEARELLMRRLGTRSASVDTAALDAIADSCARLPLALAVLAARAATQPDTSLHALASQLVDGLDVLDGGDAAANLRTVFSWSHNALSPPAARMFRLLGLHPGPEVSLAAAASLAGVPLLKARSLLTELTDASLLGDQGADRYNCHDLLRAYAVDMVRQEEDEDTRQAAVLRMADHYLHTAHAAERLLDPHREPIILNPANTGVSVEHLPDHRAALGWFTMHRSTLLSVFAHVANRRLDAHAWQLAWSLNTFFHRQGHWSDWMSTERTALLAAGRLASRPAQAYIHRDLARAYLWLGHPRRALLHYQRALTRYRKMGDLVGQGYTHMGLSWLMDQLHRPRDAWKQASTAYRLFLAAQHRVGQFKALNDLGWQSGQLGHHRRAAAHCTQSLQLAREVGDRAAEATAWDSLGYAWYQLRRSDRAINCYHRARDLYREVGNRYAEAEVLVHEGEAFCRLGSVEDARRALRQALDILNDMAHPTAEAIAAKLKQLVDQTEASP